MNLFDYSNYRDFLKDYYEDQKTRKTGFTYARFAEKAELSSPNYYKLIMDGEKNLTPSNIIRFSLALDFTEEQKDYFEALVYANQAKKNLEKEYYIEKLNRLRNKKENLISKRILEEYEFQTISNWTHHAIMLLTNLDSFRESPISIKRLLYDLISEEEVVSILKKLETLKLLERDNNGRLKQTNKRVKTKPDLKVQSANQFYEGLFNRAIQSIKIESPDTREFNTYMVGLSKKNLPELKKKIRHFMDEINEWALENQEPEQIYALSFSAFPLTKKD